MNNISPKIRALNPIAIAFIGDAVFELHVRSRVLGIKGLSPRRLAAESSKYARASGQFNALMAMYEAGFFTNEEWEVVLRGRNQKPKTVPKNASVSHYRYATGFEALIGTLYLMGDNQRIEEIMQEVFYFHERDSDAEAEKKANETV